MQSIVALLFILVVVPLFLLAHIGPLFARGKLSFWILSALAIGVSLTLWTYHYKVELSPEHFSDVGSVWSQMIYMALTSLAFASVILGAVRVFGLWQPKRWYSWALYVVAVPLLAALLSVPVGWTAASVMTDRWDEAYCSTVTSHPKCDTAEPTTP